MKRRLRVYVAGPYSANNVMDVLRNIRKGTYVSYQLMTMGFAPFCPWLDADFVYQDQGDLLKKDDFYEYSLEWMLASQAVLLQGDWKNSTGTLKEIEEANKNNIPVFENLNELVLYARKQGFKV